MASSGVGNEGAEKGEFMSYSRFAIYYIPPDGPLATFGAAWLGWDVVKGGPTPHQDLPGLEEVTRTPRKYGFHGTLKPPFRLRENQSEAALAEAVATLAENLPPATCDGLELTELGSFLALTPIGELGGIERVAAACVRDLDAFRAPATETELARRRQAKLSDRQDALLQAWGYPYVMEEFRFHLTLSGRLDRGQLAKWSEAANRAMPNLPRPFTLDEIALCGERSDGHFELVHRYSLKG